MGILTSIFGAFRKREATERSLRDQYDSFEHLKHSDRLLNLFRVRGQWKQVPEATLAELIDRLDDGDPQRHLEATVRFIIVAEAVNVTPSEVARSATLSGRPQSELQRSASGSRPQR